MANMANMANMADVARRAGVSTATVSRALRDVPGVSRATRDRVQEVARDLAYVISPEASALSRGTTGRVAVVVPHLGVWFYSAMLAGMAPVLRAAGLDLLVYQVEGEAERSGFLRELPARRKVDAVILTALPMTRTEVGRLDLMGVHVVVAGGELLDHPHVRVDDLAAGRTAVRHLIDLGHRRIGMIRTDDTDQTTWRSDVQRVRAWRETLADSGLEAAEELLVTEAYDAGAGARAVTRLLGLRDRPTAVFAYSDELAFAALAAARSRGLRVPEDLAVVGVDGHPLGGPLGVSTVDQDVEAQGRTAAELAVRLLGGEQVGHAELPYRLLVRRSTVAGA